MQLTRLLFIFLALVVTTKAHSQCDSCTPGNTYSNNATITATANDQEICITGGSSFTFSSSFSNVTVKVCAPNVTFTSVNITSGGTDNTIETWGENTRITGVTVGADTFSFITNATGATVGSINLNQMARFQAREHATLELENNITPGQPVFFVADQHSVINTRSITSNQGGSIFVAGGAEFNSSGSVILQTDGRLFNTGAVTVAGDMTVQGGSNAMNNYCGTATIDIGGTFIVNDGSISNSGIITTQDLRINSDAGPIFPHAGSVIEVTNSMVANNTDNIFRGDSILPGECATLSIQDYGAWNSVLTNSDQLYYCGPTPPSNRAGSATLSCDCSSSVEECRITCTKPEAGDDAITCTPDGEINLNEATGHQRWFTHPSNPSTATIGNYSGEVSGMDVPGLYQFILRDTLGSENETCLDTVAITVNGLPADDLSVSGRTFCSTEENTRITIENAEPDVTYSAYYNDLLLGSNINIVSSPTTIDITFPTENLDLGTNEIEIRADIDGCSTVILANTAEAVKVPNPDSEVSFSGGVFCSNEEQAIVTIDNAEPNVLYTAYRGSTSLGSGSRETEGELIIEIPISLLNEGDNNITMTAEIDGCSTVGLSDNTVIHKVPNPSASLTIDGNTVCSNNPNTTIVVRSAAPGVTYTAFLDDVEIGSSTNENTSTTNLPITIPTSALVNGSNLISVEADIDGCETVLMENLAEVNLVPQPDMTLEVEGDLVCSNQPEATVIILNSNPGVTYTAVIDGSPAGTATNTEASATDLPIAIPMSRLTTGTNTVSFRASISGCSTVDLDNTAEVIRVPNPSVSLSVNGNILCSSDGNTTYITIVNAAPGVTYSALLDGTVIGSSTNTEASATNLQVSLSTDDLENGENTLTVQADITGCATRTLEDEPVVTLDPELDPGSIEAYNNTICRGTSPQLLNNELPSGGLDPLTYTWQYSFDETDWVNISGSNTPGPMSSAPSVSEEEIFYRRKVTSRVCSAATDAYLVETTGQMDGGSIEATEPEVCKDTTPGLISSVTPASGGTGSEILYQWQISFDGNSWDNIEEATEIDYLPEPIENNTWFRRRATNGDGDCDTTYAGPITLEVYSTLEPGTIQPGDTTVCMGSDVWVRNQEGPSGGSPGYTYIWQSAVEPFTSWTDISNSDNLNYLAEDIQETTRFRRIVMNECDSDTTNFYEVQVLPNLTTEATITPAPPEVCSTDEITFTVSTENAGQDRRIDWYYNDEPFLLPSGQPDSVYTHQELWEDQDKISVIVYADPDKLCTTPSATAEVVLDVHYKIDNNEITGSDQIACEEADLETITGTDASGSLASPGYVWQISHEEGIWEDIPGANERDYLPEISTGDVLYRRIAISEGACDNDTATAPVRVRLDGEFNPGTLTADPDNICEGTFPTFTVTPPEGGLEPYTYQWERSSDNNVWSSISGATESEYDSPGLTSSTYFRRRVTSGTGVCEYVTPTVFIRVDPIVISSSNTISGDQNLCYGTEASQIAGSTPSGGLEPVTYQWISAPEGSDNWTEVPNSDSQHLNPGVLPETTRFRRIVTSTGACGSDTSAGIVRVFVDPALSPGTIEQVDDICRGTAIELEATPASGGTEPYTYQWQRSFNGNSWSNLSDETNQNLSSTVFNNSSYFRRIVYSSVCQDTTEALAVTVNTPISSGSNTLLDSQELCLGEEAAEIIGSTPSGGVSPVSYQWIMSNDSINWASLQDSTRKDLLPGTLDETTWFSRVVTSSGACANDTSAYPVKIFIDPTLTAGSIESHDDICLEEEVVLNASAAQGGTTPYSYQWQHATDNTSWTNIEGETNEQLTPYAPDASGWYRRIVQSRVCSDTTDGIFVQVDVPVDPSTNTIGPEELQELCFGSEANEIIGSTPTGGLSPVSYQWVASTDSLNWNILQDSTRRDLWPGIPEQTTWFRRTITSTGACANDTSTSTVKIFIDPSLNAGAIEDHDDICLGEEIALNASAAQGGTTPYSYQWQHASDSVSWANIEGETNEQLTPYAPEASGWYRRIVDSRVCTDTTEATYVQVDTPIDPSTNSIGSGSRICLGSTAPEIIGTEPAGGFTEVTYQWLSSPDETNWEVIEDATDKDYAPGAIENTTWYRRIVTSTGACSQDSSQASARVFVDTPVEPGSISEDQQICDKDTIFIESREPASGGTSLNYRWQYTTIFAMDDDDVSATFWMNIPEANNETLEIHVDSLITAGQYYFRRIAYSKVCYAISDTTGIYPCLTPGLTNIYDTICAMQSVEDSIVLYTDFSRNGGGLVIQGEIAVEPSNGTLAIDSITNFYTYTPDPGFVGIDTAGVTICDTSQFNQCDIKYIYITVLDTNRAPIVQNQYLSVFRNKTLEGNVLDNNSDPDNDTLFVDREVVQMPANGTFSIDTAGNFYYDPYYDYIGSDSVVVSVCDYSSIRRCNQSICKNDTIFIEVNPNTVFVPDGFSPNNDGIHDAFVIRTDVPSKISITIFNRWGDIVYENNDYKNDWQGEANRGVVIGKGLPDGTYYLRYDINDGEHKGFKYITINR
ncbi:gliding motility-associated C-terminal domain-containing protein [Cytophagaceae bacterium ABcell3]|nr:gliding motility-associated C-terminal domain-containing protein [Cytophagaceae bacterium ABcell3]